MSETHTARAHAKLAPSASHRWMECPGSVKLSEGFPNTSSIFAAEGTAAHELCSHCLETNDDPATFSDMWVDIHAEPGKPKFIDLEEEPTGADKMRYFPVDEEMVDGVQLYLDTVRGLIVGNPENYLTTVEVRLEMTHLHPDIFGTGDASVLDMPGRHLHIIDFKYGKGVIVEVEHNPQLLLYAAGTLRRFHNHNVRKVTMHVVQPRAEHKDGQVRSFEIDITELMEFEFEIEEKAKETDKPDAALKAGEWCFFCPAQAICPARRKHALAVAQAEFAEDGEVVFPNAEDLTDEQRLAIANEADGLLRLVKATQQFLHDEALAGRMPKGFKLVAKRANRKFKDPEQAEEHLIVLGVSKDEMYDAPKFKTPAKLERFFPGSNKEKRAAAMADLVEKKSSGFNLVRISDPRAPVKADAASEFEAVEID